MKLLSYVLLIVFLAVGAQVATAQETENYVNHNSTAGIPDYDIMYKKRLWRRMDLREKQNRPFFAYNNEISKLIIEAVKAGVLFPYKNDSLKTRMTKEEFLENMKIPTVEGGLTEEEKAMGFTEEDDDAWGDGWGDEESTTGDAGWGDEEADASEATSADEYFYANQVVLLEIMEDWVFDKRRSRLFYDIQAVSLVLPAENFDSGLEKKLGAFKYKDLENLFRSMPEEAIWFNPQNSAEHRNLADAFMLRLFSARLIKVSNPEDAYIADIYNRTPKDGLIASQRIEEELLQLEHELWEY